MDDGWDDEDDDVNVDDLLDDWGGEQDGNNDGGIALLAASTAEFPTTTTTAAAAATTAAAATEGWEDSDNLDLSDEDDPVKESSPPPPPQAAAPPEQEEGWDDDLDLGDLSESNHHQPVAAAPAASQPLATQVAVVAPAAVAEGWGDEEDDLDFSESNQAASDVAAPAAAAAAAAEGWDDDLDFSETTSNDPLSSEAQLPVQQPQPPEQPMSAAQRQLYQELEHYIATLPSHAASITAVLQAEYNTPQKALELQQYYAERPQLQDYTITRELPRMDYALTSAHDGDVITDKGEIARHLSNSGSPSLCARCANQSLLADVLQVLTGPDRVVRPQHLAGAAASRCKLRIDLPHQLVEVAAVLDLSLPASGGERWTVAQLCVVIVFVAPWPGDRHPPYVEYRLAELRPLAASTDPLWTERLESCSAFLARLAQDQAHMELQQQQQQQQQQLNETLNFRDAFLQQSRLASTDAVDGLKSAWQDLNAATGLGDKFARLPSFLPEADVLEAAAAQEQEQHAMLQQQEQQAAAQQKQRPTSILGGFVRNLAKSVALPDEDPDLYQEWSAKGHNPPPPDRGIAHHAPPPPAAAVAPPKLYNAEIPSTDAQAKPAEPADIPKLYHRDDSAPSSAPPAIPKLYNRDPPIELSSTAASTTTAPRLYNLETPHSQPKAKIEPAPQLYVREEKEKDQAKNQGAEMEVDDGWGDDLDFDEDDDAFEVDSTKNNVKDTAAAPVSTKISTTVSSLHPPKTAGATETKKDDDSELVVVDWQNWKYDPVTDAIPTRKRWVNPLPGRRVLGEFGGV